MKSSLVRTKDAGAILASDQAKAIRLHFLRDLPGKGTMLQIPDKELGVFEGRGFADAVFSIWLGPKPPSEDLRKGTLG